MAARSTSKSSRRWRGRSTTTDRMGADRGRIRPRMVRMPYRPAGLALLGWLGLAAGACRPTDACAEPSKACGGDPTGNWVELDSCQDPALQDTAIAKRTYRNQPVVAAGVAPPEPTSTDW